MNLFTTIFVIIVLSVSIYFTVKLDFVQIRYFREGWNKLFNNNYSPQGISPFSAAALAISGRIGTGNIVGVAFAIYLCGYGVLFWMWIASFLGMATSFVEATLAQVYKTYDSKKQYLSGPMVYIKRGLPSKFSFLAVLYGLALILTVGFIFIHFYTNIITGSILAFTGVTDDIILEMLAVFIVSLIATYTILGGHKKVVNMLAYIVPVMVITYVFLVLFIGIKHIGFIPQFFHIIITDAFTPKGVAGGGILTMIFISTYLSTVSNESGFGTATIAAGMATSTHPASQGIVNMITIFIDTLICTLTGFVFMLTLEEGMVLSNYNKTSELIMQAFDVNYSGGAVLLLAIILVFSVGSMITSITYGLQVIKYMVPTKRYKLISSLYFGSVFVLILLTPLSNLQHSTISIAFGVASIILFVINIIAILLLRNVAFKTFKHYKRTSLVFKPDELGIEYQDKNEIWK